ncbi:MAG: hypothetical protein AAGI03_00340 [Pseudomonadota bacterium]
MENRRVVFGLIGTMLLAGAATCTAAQSVIRLTPEQATCVADHVETYLQEPSEPVVVIPDTCPNPPSIEDLMAALAPQNLGRELPEPKVGESDAALVLMRSELECFETLFRAGSLVEEEGGIIAVELGDCDG